MKRVSIMLIMFGLTALGTNAQTVTGSGTTNTIPKFTGSSAIGDSQIRQIGDNIGVNTDYIVGRLSVFESREIGINFPQPYALYGNISSGTNFAAGVRGDASASSGTASGVIGVSYGQGSGVNGLAQGDGSTGVLGTTNSQTGFATGVTGTANGSTGSAVGVFGQALSPNGIAGLFINRPGGDILHGAVSQNPDKTVFRVDGHGTVFADGGFRPFGADFAESLAVKGSREHYAPGDLLVIDASGERRLSLAETPYSTLVAGIYSTKPGVVASQHPMDAPGLGSEVPLAVVGIVPCKVTAENGAIAVGDLLVTSSTPGHAMKGTDRSRMLGAVVGKALDRSSTRPKRVFC